MTGIEIAHLAKEQLIMLTGLKPDTISKLQRHEQTWQVAIEMIEMKAVPDSKDLLATYEILLDNEGQLTSYERTNRYRRGDVL